MTLLHLVIADLVLIAASIVLISLDLPIPGTILLVVAFTAILLTIRLLEADPDFERRSNQLGRRFALAVRIPGGLILIGVNGTMLFTRWRDASTQQTIYWSTYLVLGVVMIIWRLLHQPRPKQETITRPPAVSCPWCGSLTARDAVHCRSCDSDLST